MVQERVSKNADQSTSLMTKDNVNFAKIYTKTVLPVTRQAVQSVNWDTS